MKTIILDDTWFFIEIVNLKEHKMLHNSEFREAVDILLTNDQYFKMIADDTLREFKVSDKRINEFLKYIEPNNEDNMWRFKRQINPTIEK